MRIFFVVLFIAMFSLYSVKCHSQDQTPSAIDIINKSIQYHDPNNELLTSDLHFDFTETRPGGSDRHTIVDYKVKDSGFKLDRMYDGQKVIMEKLGNDYSYSVDGKSPTKTQIEKLRLNKDRLNSMSNYYKYLWAMPMKLKDEGTIIHDQVKITTFNGHDVHEVKVTYTPAVGKDIWYFYFLRSNAMMVGYRFYHDEIKNDGEYINLDGLWIDAVKNVKIPRDRTWYTHKEDKLLGTDRLTKFKID